MSNCTKPLVSDLIDKAYNVSFHLGGLRKQPTCINVMASLRSHLISRLIQFRFILRMRGITVSGTTSAFIRMA